MLALAQQTTVIEFPVVRVDQVLPILITLALFGILTGIELVRVKIRKGGAESGAVETVSKIALNLQERNAELSNRAQTSMETATEASTTVLTLEREKATLTRERDMLKMEVASLTRRLTTALEARDTIASSSTKQLKSETRRGIEYKRMVEDLNRHVEVLEAEIEHLHLIIDIYKSGAIPNETLLHSIKTLASLRSSVIAAHDNQSPTVGSGGGESDV